MPELVLHTTPSRFKQPHHEDFPLAYDRVVRVGWGSGIVSCRYAFPAVSAIQAYEVPQEFGDRTLAFFEEFIAHIDPEHRPRQHALWLPESVRYGCRVFARYIEDGVSESPTDAREYVRAAIPSAEAYVGNLPAGAHGVVVRGGDRLSSPHSTVGLGLQVPQCLQVVENDSHMAVMAYDVMFRNYGGPQGLHIRRIQSAVDAGIH